MDLPPLPPLPIGIAPKCIGDDRHNISLHVTTKKKEYEIQFCCPFNVGDENECKESENKERCLTKKCLGIIYDSRLNKNRKKEGELMCGH